MNVRLAVLQRCVLELEHPKALESVGINTGALLALCEQCNEHLRRIVKGFGCSIVFKFINQSY